MYSYKLIKSRDTDFFSSPHYDAISTVLLKDGDVICVCNDCEELFLQSSWEANDKKCCKCGCTSRKNIDENYFKRYRLQVHKVTNTRNRTAVTTRRRTAISIETVDNPTQSVSTVRRRPFSVDSVANGRSTPQTTLVTTRRQQSSNSGSASRTSYTLHNIRPQPYPTQTRKRKKTGRILLGVVVSLLVIALAIGVVVALHFTGVIDISPMIAMIQAYPEKLPDEVLNTSTADILRGISAL